MKCKTCNPDKKTSPKPKFLPAPKINRAKLEKELTDLQELLEAFSNSLDGNVKQAFDFLKIYAEYCALEAVASIDECTKDDTKEITAARHNSKVTSMILESAQRKAMIGILRKAVRPPRKATRM